MGQTGQDTGRELSERELHGIVNNAANTITRHANPMRESPATVLNRNTLEGNTADTFAMSSGYGNKAAGVSMTFFRNQLGEVEGFMVSGSNGTQSSAQEKNYYISREQIQDNPELRTGLQRMADNPGFRNMVTNTEMMDALRREPGESGPVIGANSYKPSAFKPPEL